MLSMPDSGQAPGNTASVARLVWPLLLLIVGFWLVPLALTCQLQCVPGDLGDARFNNVVLEHFYRWLGGHEASLVSPGFFYPMPGALTFSDNHWGTAWIYAIFRALGWDRYQAFDLWFLCGYLLNFVASHYVFRRLRFSPLASALAAFAFTFAMPVVARYGHAQLTYRFLIPIGLLLWQCFRGDGRWRWLAALALAVAAQFYISIYLGYFMLLFLAAWALAQWLLEGWGPRQWFEQWQHYPQGVVRRELILASLTIVAAAVMIAVLMYPYLHYSKLYGFQRAAAEIASLLPRPQSYLLADSSGVWGGLSQQLATRMPMRHEQQIFFGLGILGLMGVGLFMSRLPSRWVALGAIVIVVALTLSVGGVSLYMLLVKLPGVGSIRAMARIGLVLALPVALLVAVGVDALRTKGTAGLLVAGAFALAMVAESGSMHTVHFDIQTARLHDTGLRTQLPSQLPVDAVIFNPLRPEVPFYEDELDGVILAQSLGRPTLNGYSGNSPPGYTANVEASPEQQAEQRIGAAKAFFAEKLHLALPLEMADSLEIVRHPEPSDTPRSQMRLTEMARVSIEVVTLRRQSDGYSVQVRIHNGGDHFLTSRSHAPFRLSWQWFTDAEGPDSARWTERVDPTGGVNVAPGSDFITTFKIPDRQEPRARLAVSGVLEGRAWLHDHGMQPAVAELDAARPPNP
ncbi:hypothetical protein R1H25_13590 [Stenotrophomonas sp. C2852]|uniref:hypothetical protein n=1 Tax=Stenotrophomonas sp. C2852 TaxID=3077845 RepID=UPI00293CED7B|nr:hypothetical protein [Stenotrophomonas sp. C2852]MDV3436497.1 hypothetical protein [Stenotrophomonas sp. C2852]